MCNDGLWLSAAASALSANVRCQVDEREDSESAERQQWVHSANSEQNPLIPSDVANHPIAAKRLREMFTR
jgi:hypothetical protein